MRRYLVVANQSLAGHHVLDHARKCAALDACWYHGPVPATPTHFQVTSDGDARLLPRCRLEGTLARFHAEAIDADGTIRGQNPLRAVTTVCREERFDEIILATLPPGTSRWLRGDLPTRLAHLTGLLVTHLVADLPADSGLRRVRHMTSRGSASENTARRRRTCSTR